MATSRSRGTHGLRLISQPLPYKARINKAAKPEDLRSLQQNRINDNIIEDNTCVPSIHLEDRPTKAHDAAQPSQEYDGFHSRKSAFGLSDFCWGFRLFGQLVLKDFEGVF